MYERAIGNLEMIARVVYDHNHSTAEAATEFRAAANCLRLHGNPTFTETTPTDKPMTGQVDEWGNEE